MTQDTWQPLSRRDAGLPAPNTLYEGVPEHLQVPVRRWIHHGLQRGPIDQLLIRLKRLGVANTDMGPDYLAAGAWSEAELLDTVDAILAMGGPWPSQEAVDAIPVVLRSEPNARAFAIQWLEDALAGGDSAFVVNEQKTGLARRADPTASQAVTAAIASAAANPAAGSASDHLRNAWDAVHALKPNPSLAYSEAIKAVESAAHDVVQSNHSKATLGTMLGEMRSTRHRFTFVMHGTSGGMDMVIGMCEALWTGQTSRHGGKTPTQLEQRDEAEAAVFLAVTLVHWFASGAVKRL